MRFGTLVTAAACLLVLHSQLAIAEIVQKRATHSTLAQKNLNHSLERARRLSKGRPNDPAAAQAVVDLLLMRLQFYRDYDDLDELARFCEPWSNDTRAQAQYLCADVDAARHDFERLSHVAKRGGSCTANQKRISAIGATLEVDLGVALGTRNAGSAPAASYSAAVLAAAVSTSRGDNATAVGYYETAVTHYSDVSPYPIAWAWYQSAELLKDSNPQAAMDYYGEALKYLPDYIAPRVELAALQIDLGDAASALENLDYARQRSNDPDIHALISRALGALGKTSEQDRKASRTHLNKAVEGFSELLKRHPFAFADHAAEAYRYTDKETASQLETMLALQKQRVVERIANWNDNACSSLSPSPPPSPSPGGASSSGK